MLITPHLSSRDQWQSHIPWQIIGAASSTFPVQALPPLLTPSQKRKTSAGSQPAGTASLCKTIELHRKRCLRAGQLEAGYSMAVHSTCSSNISFVSGQLSTILSFGHCEACFDRRSELHQSTASDVYASPLSQPHRASSASVAISVSTA